VDDPIRNPLAHYPTVLHYAALYARPAAAMFLLRFYEHHLPNCLSTIMHRACQRDTCLEGVRVTKHTYFQTQLPTPLHLSVMSLQHPRKPEANTLAVYRLFKPISPDLKDKDDQLWASPVLCALLSKSLPRSVISAILEDYAVSHAITRLVLEYTLHADTDDPALIEMLIASGAAFTHKASLAVDEGKPKSLEVLLRHDPAPREEIWSRMILAYGRRAARRPFPMWRQTLEVLSRHSSGPLGPEPLCLAILLKARVIFPDCCSDTSAIEVFIKALHEVGTDVHEPWIPELYDFGVYGFRTFSALQVAAKVGDKQSFDLFSSDGHGDVVPE
jgi:hypothetical protein